MVSPTYTFRLSQHALELDASGHHDLDDMTDVNLGTPPSTNQVLRWNGSAWVPADTLTVKDEGSALATGATSIDFVGPGITASGTGAAKTITHSSALTVEEVDGSPTDSAITKIVFPNGTLAIASHVATYTAAGGGGGGGSMTVELLGATGAVTPVTTLRIGYLVDNGSGDVSLLPQIFGDGDATLEFQTSHGADLRTLDGHRGMTLYPPTSSYYIWSQHGAGDLDERGLNIEVGDDYVGLWISEKDASTIQIYPDSSGGYDVELVDRGSSFWKHVAADGGVATPSRGMLPQYSSAPGSPVEGQSYYDTTLHKTRTWNGSSWNNHW